MFTSPPSHKPDLRGVKILLIEDERVIRELVARMLKSIGITEITETSTAESAWDYLTGDKRRPFHAIITDLTLPGISGTTLIKKLRTLSSPRAKTLPVIVLTGSSDLATYKQVEASNVSSYLIKPISAAILKSAIEKALGVPAAGAEVAAATSAVATT
jgi:two-component system sensor histidine kinase/response regulator